MRCTYSKRLITACAAFCAVVSAASLAKAAVIVEAQGILVPASSFSTDASGTFSVPYTVQSANTEVVVVGLYVDGTTVPPFTGLQFNSADPDETPLGSGRDTLAYWSITPGVGTFNITGDTSQTAITIGNGYVWELSNVDVSLGVNSSVITTAGANTDSLVGSITTTSDARLVTDFYGANNQGGTVAPAAGSIISTSSFLQFGGGTGGTVAGGTGTAPTAAGSPHTLGWTGDGSSSFAAELAYAFAMPVPEPSSLMLLVGGVLMLAGRRRIVG